MKRFLAPVFVSGLLTLLGGCAAYNHTHPEFATLENRLSQIESTANKALDTANQAYHKAEMAQKTADEAKASAAKVHEHTHQCCAKIDKLFQRSMMK